MIYFKFSEQIHCSYTSMVALRLSYDSAGACWMAWDITPWLLVRKHALISHTFITQCFCTGKQSWDRIERTKMLNSRTFQIMFYLAKPDQDCFSKCKNVLPTSEVSTLLDFSPSLLAGSISKHYTFQCFSIQSKPTLCAILKLWSTWSYLTCKKKRKIPSTPEFSTGWLFNLAKLCTG